MQYRVLTLTHIGTNSTLIVLAVLVQPVKETSVLAIGKMIMQLFFVRLRSNSALQLAGLVTTTMNDELCKKCIHQLNSLQTNHETMLPNVWASRCTCKNMLIL